MAKLNISSHSFGVSPACEVLAKEFNSMQDKKLFSRFMRLFEAYGNGLENIVQMPGDGTREIVLKLWHQRYMELFAKFKEDFEKNGSDISFANNVVTTLWRQALRNGKIMEKLR